MTSALLIGCSIFLSYLLVTVNLCSVTKGHYPYTALSSVALTAVNFWLFKEVIAAKTALEFFAYLVGGLGGDFAGIWLGKHLNIVDKTTSCS